MLVYFDPWLAGVVLPRSDHRRADRDSLHRQEPEGERLLHVQRAQGRDHASSCSASSILLGLADRARARSCAGRTGTSSGPSSIWDIHKLEALTNVNLSEYIWVRAFRTGLPTIWFLREIIRHRVRAVLRVRAAGAFCAKTVASRATTRSWARRAYYVSVFLFLMMMSLPIKMLLALALQPEIHRQRFRNSSSTSDRTLMAEKKGVGHAYNVDFLNVVFAASSIFLFLSVVWMVWDDYDREWKNTQRRFVERSRYR